jgi:zinc D-Ala-D-Ala carboxypeptidase
VRLSSHFSLAEFTVSQTASRLGIDNAPTPEALENLKLVAQGLEGVRILLGVPIIISSGYRCLELNRAIGSKDSSQHVKGEAVDFEAPAYGGPRAVMDRIIDSGMDFDQCILEYPPDGWVHMSFKKSGNRHHALVIDKAGTRPFLA